METVFGSMNKFHLAIVLNLAWMILGGTAVTASGQSVVPYQDLSHDSKVFGRKKFYRLYLPDSYRESQKRFPVVYFFHGWGGRHFKDDNAKLEYEKLQELVEKYQVIMVMWDGNMEESEPRPYNVGNHEDVKYQIQMKDYFPELVSYIDATYRTLADRDNRGIIGFSMGGFMSLYLSGKYPDTVCSSVSIMGSPEFFIGTPDNHTLYPVRYAFENLKDVKIRIHTSPTDILYFLNQEVKAGAEWEGKKVEFEEFPGGHMVDKAGETLIFEKAVSFVVKDFGKKRPAPLKWSHYDLYGSFGLWGYEVNSDKKQPGFIYLKDVTSKGFGVYTKKWLPHGPVIEMGDIKVTTAPIYKANTNYQSASYSAKTGKVIVSNVKADKNGRIVLNFDAYGNETGIFTADDKPLWTFLDYQIEEKRTFKNGTNKLKIRLFNRGGNGRSKPYVMMEAPNEDATIANPGQFVSTYEHDRVATVMEFTIMCDKKPPMHAEPVDVKLRILVKDGDSIDTSVISIPVDFDVPYFTNLKIDDGKIVRQAALGKGNGDGRLNAGEQVLIYEGENRLRIYSEDPGIVNAKEKFNDEVIPARWPDGFTQSSVIYISPGSRAGQEIECLASYETKTFNPIERKTTWGRIKLTVH